MTILIGIDTFLDVYVKHTRSNYISFLLVVLGIEPRASLLLEQHPTTELYSLSPKHKAVKVRR